MLESIPYWNFTFLYNNGIFPEQEMYMRYFTLPKYFIQQIHFAYFKRIRIVNNLNNLSNVIR